MFITLIENESPLPLEIHPPSPPSFVVQNPSTRKNKVFGLLHEEIPLMIGDVFSIGNTELRIMGIEIIDEEQKIYVKI